MVMPTFLAKIRTFGLAGLLAVSGGLGCQSVGTEEESKAVVDVSLKESESGRLDWFTDARYGMFIHWGPVALKGTEIGWSRGKQVPTGEYDALYKKFNPTKFDAKRWVSIAKKAGMKYIVLTTKHHDGFCLWPSEYTDYDIGETPFKRDIVKELSEACRAEGIRFCAYYSVADWYHPDYPIGEKPGGGKKVKPNIAKYAEYQKNQARELIERYGPIGVMWFDGEWEKPWTRAYGNELYDFLREVQPSVIINNRVSKGRDGMAGTTKQSHLNAGDFDTPEREIGAFNRDRPWETCMTLCHQWAWKPNDKMKSKAKCLRSFLRVVGGDGNFLLNVGPTAEGVIEARQVRQLEEMGEWIGRYEDSIYGTRGGPYKPGKWGVATCHGDKVTLFVMDWAGKGELVLPNLGVKVKGAKLLSGGEVRYEVGEGGLKILVDRAYQREIATVIELTVVGDAKAIKPIDTGGGSKKR